MAKKQATTVKAYLDELPAERRAVVSAVRKVIRKNLPKGYQETLDWGIISYAIPLKRYPNTYNDQPLCYLGLAARKNFYTLHLMRAYGDPKHLAWLKEEFKKAGKKLDMGKSCIHFRTLGDLPLEVIGQSVASTPVEKWIDWYEASRKK